MSNKMNNKVIKYNKTKKMNNNKIRYNNKMNNKIMK